MPSHLKLMRDFRNYFYDLSQNNHAKYEIQKIKQYYPGHILFEGVSFNGDMLSLNEFETILKNLNEIIDDTTYEGYERRDRIDRLYDELFGIDR